MSLNVILGKSNTGKSEYMFRQIMACENSNKQAILFVPPSGRIIAEEEYMKYTNKTTLIDTKITSIERFVSRSIDKNELYEDKDFLPELAKKILIRKVISENPDIIIDGAHNPEAVEKLVISLKNTYGDKKLRMVFGAFKDKNVSAMLEMIAPLVKELVAVRVPTERAMEENQISDIARKKNINVIAIKEPRQAVEYYLSQADNSPIICFGSLSYLKEIKDMFRND